MTWKRDIELQLTRIEAKLDSLLAFHGPSQGLPGDSPVLHQQVPAPTTGELPTRLVDALNAAYGVDPSPERARVTAYLHRAIGLGADLLQLENEIYEGTHTFDDWDA